MGEDSRKRQSIERRPLKSRSLEIFIFLSKFLARKGVSPNLISASSLIFAFFAGIFFVLTNHNFSQIAQEPNSLPNFHSFQNKLLWFLGAIFVQLRLLANMLDGMVAVDSKFFAAQANAKNDVKSSNGQIDKYKAGLGELYNEVPDRIADLVILLGFALAQGGDILAGLLAGIGALLTAYIRAEGFVAGAGQVFSGPMAKPHRMFFVTLGALVCALAPGDFVTNLTLFGYKLPALFLWFIFCGTLLTFLNRLLAILKVLKS